MKKIIYKSLVYISIIFVILYLYKNDYIFAIEIKNYYYFVLSVMILYLGYYIQSYAIAKLFEAQRENISIKIIMISEFTTIFSKYLPGKVATLIAPSVYICDHEKISFKNVAIYMFYIQILFLWVGIIISSLLVINFDIEVKLLIVLMIVTILISLIIFTKFFHNLFLKIINKIFSKNISFPYLEFSTVKTTLPWIVLRWVLWVLAFSLVVSSITNDNLNLFFGLAFIFASVFGVVAIFTPGGLGVREGVLASVFILMGDSAELATTIAVFSRLWFILGELLVFLTGVLLKHQFKKY